MAVKGVLILSIETTGLSCSVALHENGAKTAEYFTFGTNLHDKLAAEFVRRMLVDLNLHFSDISAVAVSSGPGSFTGLRIGGSIAKGLCFGNNPPLIAVPTLTALAFSAIKLLPHTQAVKIIPVIASNREQFYWQEFSVNGEALGGIMSTTIEELKIASENALLCGPGVPAELEEEPFLNVLSADFTGVLAFKLFEQGVFINSEDYTPLYIQSFEPKTSVKTLNI